MTEYPINRHYVAATQMKWSSDFPHGGSDWPGSLAAIHKYFDGAPIDQRHAMLAGDALRIYGQEASP